MMLHNNQREVTGKRLFILDYLHFLLLLSLAAMCKIDRNELEQKEFNKSYLYWLQDG